MRSRTLAIIGIAAGLLAVAGVLVAIVVFGAVDSRRYLSPGYFAPTEQNEYMGALRPVLDGLSDQSPSLCDASVPCVEGWANDRVELMRFDSEEAAEEHRRSLGENGHQSDWLVLRYVDPSLTADERLFLRQVLDGTWTSD